MLPVGRPTYPSCFCFGGERWRRWILPVAALATALTLLGWFYSSTGSESWIVATNRLISIGVVWLVALGMHRFGVLSEERDMALAAREAALEKVQLLEGLLPICSYCKRIQEDDDTWTELEAYVLDHAAAEFSHGLCESCLREHYPDHSTTPPRTDRVVGR